MLHPHFPLENSVSKAPLLTVCTKSRVRAPGFRTKHQSLDENHGLVNTLKTEVVSPRKNLQAFEIWRKKKVWNTFRDLQLSFLLRFLPIGNPMQTATKQRKTKVTQNRTLTCFSEISLLGCCPMLQHKKREIQLPDRLLWKPSHQQRWTKKAFDHLGSSWVPIVEGWNHQGFDDLF